MADITVTAASVAKAVGSPVEHGTAGATITAGQVVYLDTSDNEWKLADADALGTSGDGTKVGIALNGASDGQPITVQTGGNINPGGTVVVGEIYCVSTTAGGIAPEADVGSGDFVTVLGIGTTATNIKLNINISSKAIP